MGYRPSGLPPQTRHLPACYHDKLPPNPIPVPVLPTPVEPDALAADNLMDDDIQQCVDWVCTEHDPFELFREYPHAFPTYDSENLSYFDHLCDAPTFSHVDGGVEHEHPWWAGFGSSLEAIHQNYFTPFLNTTIFQLMNWFYNASLQKLIEDLRHLVNDVMLAEDFD
ncbi:uncharacterized protein F5891DRAFT_1189739 [Suillus fuscotomentosus]|uniref:Uncharacterized protein n=1 Tax=Suillus fuscotomentosus TaxID=1912939 RepID=A0AAD4HJZ7_9AGAM|nr:uncharacterized protein F5891DRAFT_1189739 [Suillus fuscotomentosus]KAG1899307.1 hypothetical protein F5891DRAFT_1189739 [Suillus fuscotomentosus]